MTGALPEPLARLGLTTWPFPRNPAADACFHWPALDELQARLAYAHAIQGFALVTGEPGCGKSTAVSLFAGRLDKSRYPVVYFADSHLTPSEFYAMVLEQFGVRPALHCARRRRQFQTLFSDMATNQAITPVVVIDEAHELAPEMIQELRYADNLGLGSASAFTLILCGQSEIRAQLHLKSFEAVAQRITVRGHLTPLTPAEMTAFVAHGLRAGSAGSAGSPLSRTVFTDPALEILYAKSRGLARKVGTMATQALLDAAIAGKDLVEADSVERAAADLEETLQSR